MTILFYNLKRICQKKPGVFVIALLPALILCLVSSSLFSPHPKLTIGLADSDRTDYTKGLAHKLALAANMKPVAEEQIAGELFQANIDYALVLDKGFTEKLLKGEDVQAAGYYVKSAGQIPLVQEMIDNHIVSAKKLAEASGGNEEKFYQGLSLADAGHIRIERQAAAGVQRQKSYYLLGTVVEILLLTTVMLTTMLQNDKGNKTFVRTLTAPVTLRSCLLQYILSFLLIAMVQVGLMFLVVKGILRVYTGDSILLTGLLFLAAAVLAVSLGVALNSLAQNMLQASFAGVFTCILFTTLGGCLWEHDMATAPLNNIGKFTPVYWVMDGVGRLLDGQGFWAAGGDILLVLLFAALFFLLGSWKKEDAAA